MSSSLPPAPFAARAGASENTATTVAKRALPRTNTGRGWLGLGMDVGMPDGANLGLILSPARWLRLEGALGTNSAALDYRGGITYAPVGWGPSITLELGRCNLAEMNGVLRTFFSVANWVKPYVQQFGYTYFNAHLGFDVPAGNFLLFVHAGYTYLAGTVRGSDPVVVGRNSDTTPNLTVTVGQDGDVHAQTLSGKLGVLYMFGGL